MSITKLTWKESKTKYGLKPSRTIYCPVCGSEMFLRASTIKNLTHSPAAWVNDMTWKCKGCSKTETFGPPMEWSHALEVLEIRGEQVLIPIEDWKKDKILRKRLETLGYV